MKNILLFIALLCIFSATTKAQTDTIAIKKRGLAFMYQKDGKALSMKMLERTMAGNPDASRQLRKGKNVTVVSVALSFTGGLVTGYELGSALGSGRALNIAVIGAGVGLIVIAIPFSVSAHKHIESAVRTYNDSRRKTGCLHFEPDLYLAFTGNGVGLRVRF